MAWATGIDAAPGDRVGLVVIANVRDASLISEALIKLIVRDRFIVTTVAAVKHDTAGAWGYAWADGLATREISPRILRNALASRDVIVASIPFTTVPSATDVLGWVEEQVQQMGPDAVVGGAANVLFKPLNALGDVIRETVPEVTERVVTVAIIAGVIVGALFLLWLIAQIAPALALAKS